eukprot:8640205-Alexandrium_andersonii.AAC.1
MSASLVGSEMCIRDSSGCDNAAPRARKKASSSRASWHTGHIAKSAMPGSGREQEMRSNMEGGR